MLGVLYQKRVRLSFGVGFGWPGKLKNVAFVNTLDRTLTPLERLIILRNIYTWRGRIFWMVRMDYPDLLRILQIFPAQNLTA